MELNDPSGFQRLTGLAYFTPTDAADPDVGIGIAFGNIVMLKLPTNPKTISAYLNKRGGQVLAKRDLHLVEPVWEIHSDQWADPSFRLQLMGLKSADLVQASATGSTFTFTAKAGRAFRIPARNATITSVKVVAAEKTPGTDYFVDDPNVVQPTVQAATTPFISQNGWFHLPVLAAGIADGSVVTVTYNPPALTLNQYSAFTNLNRKGTLLLELEDSSGGAPREEWSMTVQLSVKNVGDADPAKFRESVLECSIFGFPAIIRKP